MRDLADLSDPPVDLSLTVRRVRSVAVIDRIATRWDGLADRASAPPWMRPGWFLAWLDAFGRGRPEIWTAEGDGELRAVLPLSRRGAATHSLTNWHTPGFGVLADSDEAARAVVRACLASRPRVLDLSFVPSADPHVPLLRRQMAARRYTVLGRVLERSPTVTIGERTWDDFEASLDRKMVREIRRRRRLLEERGPVSVDISKAGDELESHLREALAIEASGWKGAGRTAIASRPETERFYRRVASWAAERSFLRLALLRVGDQAIAFDFALEDPHVHALLKTGYDESFAKYGPGQILRWEMLRGAFARRVRRYDFLGTDAAWKQAWTRETDDLLRLQAFAPTPTGRAAWAAWRYGRPALRALRR